MLLRRRALHVRRREPREAATLNELAKAQARLLHATRDVRAASAEAGSVELSFYASVRADGTLVIDWRRPIPRTRLRSEPAEESA